MWQTNVKISLVRKWNWRQGHGGMRQKHLSFRCSAPQHTHRTVQTLKPTEVCVSVWAFVFACAYVETLKWDHRLNWAKALDTNLSLINSPIRKYLHWQKCWGGWSMAAWLEKLVSLLLTETLHLFDEHDPDQHKKNSHEQYKTDCG